ncbi:MAG: hypothetical protein ACXWJU_04190 [Hyphomicrobium sp.]
MATEMFSFTLRPVETYGELLRCCKVRSEAYGRLDPAFRDPMAAPDEIDHLPWTMIFLCEDKATGRVVGTMRVQTTTRGSTQLAIEKYVVPPPQIAAHGRGEITRLASVQGADPFVRVALWKAGYLYCMANQVRWLLMAVRRASLLREYLRMGANDIHEDHRSIPLPYAGNLPHRILSLDLGACEQTWREMNHPLQPFMFTTVHPDLSIIPSMNRIAPKDAVSLKVA